MSTNTTLTTRETRYSGRRYVLDELEVGHVGSAQAMALLALADAVYAVADALREG